MREYSRTRESYCIAVVDIYCRGNIYYERSSSPPWPALRLLERQVGDPPSDNADKNRVKKAKQYVLVARIAYRTSDVVLSVQPALHAASLFSAGLKKLAADRDGKHGTPEVWNQDELHRKDNWLCMLS